MQGLIDTARALAEDHRIASLAGLEPRNCQVLLTKLANRIEELMHDAEDRDVLDAMRPTDSDWIAAVSEGAVVTAHPDTIAMIAKDDPQLIDRIAPHERIGVGKLVAVRTYRTGGVLDESKHNAQQDRYIEQLKADIAELHLTIQTEREESRRRWIALAGFGEKPGTDKTENARPRFSTLDDML